MKPESEKALAEITQRLKTELVPRHGDFDWLGLSLQDR